MTPNNYEVAVDWEVKFYCSLNIDWNYDDGYVGVSMKEYVNLSLKMFEHKQPSNPQHTTNSYMEPVHGQYKLQYPTLTSIVSPINKEETCHIQSIVGAFFY